MAKEQSGGDFDLGFSPEEFEKITPDQGLGFSRVRYGDFTFEISVTEIQAAKNTKKPHNMLKVTSRVVASVDPELKTEIGSEITNFYAGSPQSPEFMKKRLKALCVATGVNPTKQGGLKGSSFVGKRYDASVVWELSKSDKLDDFGRPKFYVNDRLKGERKVGSERPKGLNPVAESSKAEQYLANGSDSVLGGAPAAETAPWDTTSTDAAVDTAGDTAAGYMAESEVDGLGYAYRAVFKLGGDDAEGAKETLIGAGIDPEGPIKIEMIEDPELRKAYEAKFGEKPKTGGLPPLNGSKARTGTRAPAAAVR